jgi:hypothetical protein
MSELWKKKLLDEQRTHVLKGSNCTVKNIKYYFQQIWPMIINEKRDDDDENKTFKDKCQQAFQQANIQLIVDRKEDLIGKKFQIKSPKKKMIQSNIYTDEIVDQLNHLLTVIGQVREQINSTQILKIKNNDCKHSHLCFFCEIHIYFRRKIVSVSYKSKISTPVPLHTLATVVKDQCVPWYGCR